MKICERFTSPGVIESAALSFGVQVEKSCKETIDSCTEIRYIAWAREELRVRILAVEINFYRFPTEQNSDLLQKNRFLPIDDQFMKSLQ